MIKEFIEYTQLADNKVMEVFRATDKNMPEAERLFSHILNAQHVWAKRIAGADQHYEIWQVHKKQDFEEISVENFKLIKTCIADKAFETQIIYKDSKGNEYQNAINEMLMQMLNHSTYHRGQVVTLLKNEGLVPPTTDYIFFKRKNLL